MCKLHTGLPAIVGVKGLSRQPAQAQLRAQLRASGYAPAVRRWSDDDVARLLRNTNWKPLYSQGRMFYQECLVQGVPTPMYLMSWDAVVKDAAVRHHTFLELLKARPAACSRTDGRG